MENYLMELMNRTLKTKDDGESQYFEHVLTFFSIAIQMKSKKILIIISSFRYIDINLLFMLIIHHNKIIL